MNIRFNEESPVGKKLLWWWTSLPDHLADRAALRRANSITSVTLTPAYQRLCRTLGAVEWSVSERDRLAAIVGLLSHVKLNDGRPLAEAMSEAPPGSDRLPVSQLRFLRLLDSPDIEALFTGLRRALPLMNHGVDILALANDVFFWGDAVRKSWAYAYRWPPKTAD